MRSRALFAAAALAALAAASPASAQAPAASPAGADVPGFAVRPPAPLVATPSPNRQHDASYEITSSAGEPKGVDGEGRLCQVGFKLAPANNRLSQSEINALVEEGTWRTTSRAILSSVFDILREEAITLGPARGVEYVTAPKTRPEGDPVRIVLVIVETPKGRMSASCAVRTAELDGALPVLRSLRDGVTLPQ